MRIKCLVRYGYADLIGVVSCDVGGDRSSDLLIRSEGRRRSVCADIDFMHYSKGGLLHEQLPRHVYLFRPDDEEDDDED